MSRLDDLPVLGIGVGFRPELHREQSRYEKRIDWFELIADRYLRTMPEGLDRALPMLGQRPLVPHGLEMSVGADEPLDLAYCDQVAELVRTVRAPFCSDHLCMTRVGGLEIGQLTPLPFTPATAARCAAKARAAQEILGVPFLLENIAYGFAFPSPMGEAELITRVVTEADCGLLLDLANVFINAQNHRYDPYAFLDALPLDRVIQVHLAGGERRGERWVDSHSRPVDAHPEVWGLLDYVVRRSPLRAILIERDQSFPDSFEEILADIEHAREIFEGGRGGRTSAEERAASPSAASSAASSAAPPASLPVDSRAFQIGLARVVVDPAVRRRFVADPAAAGRELGLDDAQIGALSAAGADRICTFAQEVEGKRLTLLSKATPAVYRLLQVERRLHDVGHRFIEEYLPRASPEFINRTVRDGFWLLMLLDRMIAEGETCPHLADVVRFERVELELLSSLDRIESARAFRRAYDAQPEPSLEQVLAARPRLGPHTGVERFDCNVVGLVRRLLDGESPDSTPATVSLVLFSKAPGWRNVHHLAINEPTRRLISLCDGSRTTAEIAALVSPGVGSDERSLRAERCALVVRKLYELNAVALDPAGLR